MLGQGRQIARHASCVGDHDVFYLDKFAEKVAAALLYDPSDVASSVL